MNKNTKQEQKKRLIKKYTKCQNHWGSNTHTHTRYVYKIIEIAKKSIFAVQRIDRNINLKMMELQPYDTS